MSAQTTLLPRRVVERCRIASGVESQHVGARRQNINLQTPGLPTSRDVFPRAFMEALMALK